MCRRADVENRKLGKTKRIPKKYLCQIPEPSTTDAWSSEQIPHWSCRSLFIFHNAFKDIRCLCYESADSNVRASSFSITRGICPLYLSCYVSIRTFHITLSDEVKYGVVDVQ